MRIEGRAPREKARKHEVGKIGLESTYWKKWIHVLSKVGSMIPLTRQYDRSQCNIQASSWFQPILHV